MRVPLEVDRAARPRCHAWGANFIGPAILASANRGNGTNGGGNGVTGWPSEREPCEREPCDALRAHGATLPDGRSTDAKPPSHARAGRSHPATRRRPESSRDSATRTPTCYRGRAPYRREAATAGIAGTETRGVAPVNLRSLSRVARDARGLRVEPLGDGLGTLFVRALDRLLHAEPPAREVVPDGAHWQRDAVLPLEQRTEDGARASTPPAWEPSHRIDTVLWWAPRAAPISVTGRPSSRIAIAIHRFSAWAAGSRVRASG